MGNAAHQKIFFHVGLGKVASSYLQQCVFPKLQGVYYLPTRKYKHCKKIIPKVRAERILVSREFDRQFARELEWFTETYPEAGIIIVLRRHDSWIASQYRRHVKNGWYFSFEDFFDIEKDRGMWKQDDLLYYPKLRFIERHSRKKPLVLFYDELLEDSWMFIDKIAAYTSAGYSKEKISLRKVHSSYTEKQLKLLRVFCRKLIRKVPEGYPERWRHWLLYRPYWLLFHLVMYVAYFVPDRCVSKLPLISESSLQKIRKAYAEDWRKVIRYAEENNPSFSRRSMRK